MAKKRKQLPLLEKVPVTGVAAEGKAIARVDGMTVFVPYAVPGDVADIQITKKKSNYAEGKVTRFESFSENRADPFCEHFGTCGGCKWQILPYGEQLKYKQKQVEDNLTRIGKVELPEISPILGAPETTFYRNKLEFTFSDKRWLTEKEISSGSEPRQMDALGFHIPGMFDKVLDINKCWLQDDLSNQIRNAARDFCLKNKFSFFDLRNQSGLMRTLILRNTSVGEWMVIVVFYEDDAEKREMLLNFLAGKFPQITSLLYIINRKANDTITDQEVICWKGREYIVEEMEGLQFKIGPKSFYQTNSRQAYSLYKVAREFAGLSGSERVYDLYTGTGTIANFVARNAGKVIGIEFVEEAIEDARKNSRNNNIENTSFFAGDMRKILTVDFIREHGRPDVIITDPPRAGMHDDVIGAILFAEPQRIVYVSCNPATQARDLNLLDSKYRVARVQPVDMFPQTHHVENVVLLERRT
ncbi:MAG: 23S rRNA (uracil(1939)-C(5))-methyltransferase RlmD [Petrimonas sp.]|jgi:23S rRNA (uracil1939-C5)-methyltransferase|uniref:23S rRNA (uracil(1939)-C(5))-methyltransferase RlmD n=1 Tax=Petrimonas TaxID=307628 RepID=UPI000E8C97B1|nr:23S rRNA (uracil(1939)-C(5))-methyltransferase RlmD [Petrimonas sp.]NLU28480.1 23S rRNA (uracil(1939)-C(5))-methyltransferase RlmD [Bacteroidales bacterium]BBD46830.1 23S rRNA (uracil-5-)-methyltransferase RumA [Petrimonas sp. IBARAKI]HAC72834.1 23S rRNA (uracil(1939)-C(5))-methyltransferase RlmD [Porphyromonadaceae bacterium]MDD2910682.1 23S rRNA (uracil(1939)-C(5))-methyltransferase RlmD [Petrimonas sp.]